MMGAREAMWPNTVISVVPKGAHDTRSLTSRDDNCLRSLSSIALEDKAVDNFEEENAVYDVGLGALLKPHDSGVLDTRVFSGPTDVFSQHPRDRYGST